MTRMKLEEFIANVKKVNEKKDFPEEFLRDCYNNIQCQEIKCCRNLFIDSSLNIYIWKYI